MEASKYAQPIIDWVKANFDTMKLEEEYYIPETSGVVRAVIEEKDPKTIWLMGGVTASKWLIGVLEKAAKVLNQGELKKRGYTVKVMD